MPVTNYLWDEVNDTLLAETDEAVIRDRQVTDQPPEDLENLGAVFCDFPGIPGGGSLPEGQYLVYQRT
jgi:hypothetical protein